MKKPKLLLLDANVVLVSYRLGIWEQLKAKYEIYTSSIVAAEEVKYVKTPTGSYGVDLVDQAAKGEIHIVEASATEMAVVVDNFVDAFRQGLDSGEMESIAVMLRGDLEGCIFCTGDTNGIQAIGMLGIGQLSISLEEVLDQNGLTGKLPMQLPPEFSRHNRDFQIEVGRQRRLTGEYFKKSPFGF